MELLLGLVLIPVLVSIAVLLLGAGLAAYRSRRSRQGPLTPEGDPAID